MTPQRNRNRKLLIWLAPSLLVVWLYHSQWRTPQLKLIQGRTQKLSKLEASHSKVMKETELASNELKEIESSLDTIESSLARIAELQRSSTRQREEIRSEFFRSDQPALQLTKTIELFRQNQLICIDSARFEAKKGSDEKIEATLGPILVLLGKGSGGECERQQYRLKLQGTFRNLQSALHSMRDQIPSIVTLSLEMEESSSQTDLRTWVLSLLI